MFEQVESRNYTGRTKHGMWYSKYPENNKYDSFIKLLNDLFSANMRVAGGFGIGWKEYPVIDKQTGKPMKFATPIDALVYLLSINKKSGKYASRNRSRYRT